MRFSYAPLLASGIFLLTGCAANPVFTSTSTPAGSVPGATLKGMVRGGQNPIVGAHVYLYAVNTTGYGGAGIPGSSTNMSVSLLKSATGTAEDGNGNYYVTTDSTGSFTITGDYTCPLGYAHPYLYASGGNPGSGPNSAAVLVSGLGSTCSTPTYTVINEVSTIAAAYSYAGFSSDPLHSSSSNTALAAKALDNATEAIANLENPETGQALATTPAGNGTVPQAEIDTLANILAACVNSSGPSSTPCTTLFNNAPSAGFSPTIPTDTSTAALNIAQNPGANIANLFTLQTAGAPFQPSLGTAPNDFTIAISYTATTPLNSPTGLAIDSEGDVWVASNGGNGLAAFGPNGTYALTITTGGLNQPWGIATDGSGNLWVSNHGANTISEFGPAGVANASSPFSGGGLTAPEGLAVDAQSHLWIANPSTGVLSEFSVTNGSAVSSTGITAGGLNSPGAVAIDDNGDIWVSNTGGSGSLSVYNVLGSPLGSSPLSGGGLDNPGGFAIDSNNNAWVANRGANVISSFNDAESNNATGYSGGGLNGANSVAVDSSDNKWVVNRTGNSISEFTAGGTAVSPSTGYYGGSTTSILSTPISIAVDLTGNIWVTNSGNNTITEFVGLGSPTVTPIAANIITGGGYGDSAVNKP
jgi:hypothetical protein